MEEEATTSEAAVSDYATYVNRLEEKFNEFVAQARQGEKVKAAALRARKISMELRNSDLKDFRTISVKNDRD